MINEADSPSADAQSAPKLLTPAAQRALDEAAARRLAQAATPARLEHDGPKGVEPTRFGDWERKGIAYDF
jgi:hypothetical protein